ncbi:MAG TPA: hypothetical protein VJ872_08610 [Nocardioides sp.]|nr:hypothetical protein [Nocardioides sp.]
MHELVGRLTALDPDASESLKVVAYFDTLILAGAGLDALLRGAAALSGTVAGAERNGRVSRRRPDGQEPPEPPAPPSSEKEYTAGKVWLEREGRQHANDEMVLERLALALDLLEARRSPTGDLDVALDATRPLDERIKALGRLRISPTSRVCVLATYAESRQTTSPLTTLIPTRYGIVQATLCRSEVEPPTTPAGFGLWLPADRAPESWESALYSLRLTGDGRPVVDAIQMGALIVAARAYDPEAPHDDVRAVARLDERSAHILLVLVESDSLRAAAAELGMHHSTLQAKHEWLTRELGYDPRTINGRIRYGIAEMLRRLTDPRVLP